MKVEVQIDKVQEAKVKRLIAQLSPERVARRIAPVCKQVWVDHLAAKPQNKMGWKTTKFWDRAARSIKYQLRPDGFDLNAHHLGMRQRFYGGTIKPVKKKWLTIPARSEAYGKTAGQFKGKLHFRMKKGGASATLNDKKGGVYFWLVKKVEQPADPTVIPPASKFLEAMRQSIASMKV